MEHILSLSYGKDSLACLGAIEQLGLPLDRIIHAEVWATDTIPADLPTMVEFKKKADATIKELADYDVVMWEKHGIFAVDRDVMAAFDQIDVLNKSALIYIAAKNMGFEPDGMSQEQMKEMSVAFNLPK